MKKLMFYGLMLAVFFLSGCVMRVSSREVDRVDQKIVGNRGFIFGKAATLPEKGKQKTKTIYDVEIELGSPYDIKREKTEDGPSAEGNKGYVQKKDVYEKETTPLKTQDTTLRQGVPLYPGKPQVIYQKPAVDIGKTKDTVQTSKTPGKETGSPQETYMVEEGDTLQKISKKFYGTTRQWKKIYEANKEVLKSPDMIKPGQRLLIP